MGRAKEIRVAPIARHDADRVVKAFHYSHTTVNNSQLNLGVFMNGRCCGAMMLGPSLFQSQMIGLVRGSTRNSFLELNRMAFSEALPRNSESRALAVAMRLLRQHLPRIKWVVSFADATRCGDGTIYRAAGFTLTGIKRNASIRIDPQSGQPTQSITAHTRGLDAAFRSWKKLAGFQLRYVRFVDPTWCDRLTVAPIPFGRIDELGARMYRGERLDSAPGDERPSTTRVRP